MTSSFFVLTLEDRRRRSLHETNSLLFHFLVLLLFDGRASRPSVSISASQAMNAFCKADDDKSSSDCEEKRKRQMSSSSCSVKEQTDGLSKELTHAQDGPVPPVLSRPLEDSSRVDNTLTTGAKLTVLANSPPNLPDVFLPCVATSETRSWDLCLSSKVLLVRILKKGRRKFMINRSTLNASQGPIAIAFHSAIGVEARTGDSRCKFLFPNPERNWRHFE